MSINIDTTVVSVLVVPTLTRRGGGGVLGHVLTGAAHHFLLSSHYLTFFLSIKTNITDPEFPLKLAQTVAKHL